MNGRGIISDSVPSIWTDISRCNKENLIELFCAEVVVTVEFMVLKSSVFYGGSGTNSTYFFSLQELSDVRILEKWWMIYHPLQIPVERRENFPRLLVRQQHNSFIISFLLSYLSRAPLLLSTKSAEEESSFPTFTFVIPVRHIAFSYSWWRWQI